MDNFYLALVNGDPIDGGEPFVVLDVRNSIFQVAKAFGQINLEQVLQQVLQLIGEMRWKFDLILYSLTSYKQFVIYLSRDNLLIDLNWLICKEWRIASCHFVDQHTQGPPIDCFVVTLDQNIIKLTFSSNFTLLRMISGAKYSGVPHKVHVLPLTRLAKPKSVIWTK